MAFLTTLSLVSLGGAKTVKLYGWLIFAEGTLVVLFPQLVALLLRFGPLNGAGDLDSKTCFSHAVHHPPPAERVSLGLTDFLVFILSEQNVLVDRLCDLFA